MIFDMLRVVVKNCIVYADYLCRATIFLAFTFYPSLFKAIRLSTKVHSQHFRQLIALQFDRNNYLNAYFSLKERFFAWVDAILFYHLMTAYRLVEEWSHAFDRTRRKHFDGDSTIYLRSIFNETVESIPIPLPIRRILRAGSFVDVSLVRFIKLQLHYSKVQYALTWVLYQMIYRPPLAFLYLMSTIVNELSFFIFSGDHHKNPVRSQSRCPDNDTSSFVDHGRPVTRRETLADIAEKVNRTLPSPPESLGSGEMVENERSRRGSFAAYNSDDSPIGSPELEYIDAENQVPYFYGDLFCLERFFLERFRREHE